jgi:hypothetical protein
MSDVTELLDRAVVPYTGRLGDWDAVLRDAGVVRRRLTIRAAVAFAAVAAIVVHLVTESGLPKTVVDLRTGARREVRARDEVWFDPQAGFRERETFEGVVQWDTSIEAARMHPHTGIGVAVAKGRRAGTVGYVNVEERLDVKIDRSR